MAVMASEDQDPDTGLKPKRGGKLNRSETVTVRLDPRLNYLAELAARAQRRTKSSFIEWAVETVLKSVTVPNSGNLVNHDKTVDELATVLWDVDEADRLVALAFHAPILMTHEEQVMWKIIREYGLLWQGHYVEIPWDSKREKWSWIPDQQYKLQLDQLRRQFDSIRQVAAGEMKTSELPLWSLTRTKPGEETEDDLDDDIPF